MFISAIKTLAAVNKATWLPLFRSSSVHTFTPTILHIALCKSTVLNDCIRTLALSFLGNGMFNRCN